jgi:hypothetical protein
VKARNAVLGLGAVLVLGATAITLDAGRGATTEPDPSEARATTTAAVESRDLVVSDTYDGTLGYGTSSPVEARAPGVVTSTAAVGDVVGPGSVLYELDLQPTVLLTGAVPAFRALSVASEAGSDVTQLEQGLVEAGFGAEVVVDETFDSATSAAVLAWEEALGRFTPDGVVELGDVVFAPEPVRVAAISAAVGSQVQAGSPVIEVGSTVKVVSAEVSVDATANLSPGASVAIELPDRSDTTGTVTDVGNPTTTQTNAGPGGATPTVTVTIALDDPASADDVDSGAVEITAERSRVDGAVAAPVTALLALVEGGYAVELVDESDPTGRRLVGVEVGAYAEGFVQVRGDGVEPGVEVVVPE